MTAAVYYLPPPRVVRALEELAEIGTLAIDAWRLGDRDLLSDCERWHGQRQAIVDRARRRTERRAA